MNTPIEQTNIGVQDVSPDSQLSRYQNFQTDNMPVAQPQVDTPMPVADGMAGQGGDQYLPTQPAQQVSYNQDLNAPPTPEELQAIGVDPVQHAALNSPPTQEELKAIGVIPKTKDDHIQEKGGALLDVLGTLKDSYLAAGHEVGSLAGGVVKNVGKLVGSQTTEDLGALNQAVSDNIVNKSRESSPIAGALGKYGADAIAAIAATPASSSLLGGVAAGAAGGATAALATGNSDSVVKSVAEGAAGGAAVMGVLGVGGALFSKVLKPLVNGGGLIFKNQDDLINATMNAAIAPKGGDITKVSPQAFLDTASNIQGKAKTAVQALYKARDDYAAGIKATVDRTGLSSLVNDLQATAMQGSTESIDASLAAAKRALGNGSSLSFNKAQDLMSSLGDDAFSAQKSGNLAVSRGILNVKDTLQKDITNSIPDEQLQALHGAASQYYSQVYSPIAKLQIDKKLTDKYTQDAFVAKFANSVLDTPSALNAMGTIDPTIRQQAIAATVNALKDASTVDGKINMDAFSSRILKETGGNKAAYGDSLDNLNSLARIMAAKSSADLALPRSKIEKVLLVGSGVGGFLVGGFPGAAAGIGLDKSYYLLHAGQMLKNPQTQELLRSATNLMNGNKNPQVLQNISTRIGSTINKTDANLPEAMRQALQGGAASAAGGEAASLDN